MKSEKSNTSAKTDRFLRFCNITVTVIMIGLTGYLFLLSIFGTSMITGNETIASVATEGFHYETTAYLTDSPLLHVASIVLIFLLGHMAVSHLPKPSDKHIGILLIVVHVIIAIIMLIAIFICNYLPAAAQYWTLNAARNLINGEYAFWAHSGFNYIYPQLNALTLFLVPSVFFFGMKGGAIVFRIFNLGMLIAASYSLYGFCKETKCTSVITTLLFILYLPLALYVFFIYGNIASLSFSLISIWLTARYLMHHKIKDAILCALTITLGALFKDTALITMIAILVVFGIYGITSRRWKQLLWIPIFILVYLGCSMAVDTVIEGVTGEEVPAGLSPYGHLTMGISEGNRANGWYNDFTFNTLIACGYDYDLYRLIAKEAFRMESELFWSDPSYVVGFFAKKTASQWNNPTFQSIWIHQQMIPEEETSNYSLYIDGSSVNMIFYYIFNLMQSIILFGSLCYFIFESKKASLVTLIPAITFIGGFIFLLFWEAKAQYTLLFFVMLFPYAATGFTSLFNGFTVLFKADNDETGTIKKWYRSKEVVFIGLLLCIILLLAMVNSAAVNNTIKLGTDDDLYDYYLEQTVNYYMVFLK